MSLFRFPCPARLPLSWQGRWIAATTVLLLLLGGCAGVGRSDGVRAPAAAANADAPRLLRVVMLMRHGVRPPTRAQVAPEGSFDRPWPTWPVGLGELTPRGYQAVVRLGAWDRRHWVGLGLLAEQGCPRPGDLALQASHKSRTQDTARALAEGMYPGCPVEVTFPATAQADAVFHPFDAGATGMDPARAMREVRAMLPPGGEAALVADNAARLALLERALGCCTPSFCQRHAQAAGCGIQALPSSFDHNESGRPKVGELLGTASTVSQTFLLEYLEGFPMQQVAWGRLSRGEIAQLLEFHRIKFLYEGRAPYVAAYAASPLARRMLDALETGPRLTVLAGHDTNIADLGGLLELHWQVPGYPRDDPPPGGALGLALYEMPDGQRHVRAFYRSQTMDQVRGLEMLDGANPAYFEELTMPGCGTPCRLETFAAWVAGKQPGTDG